MPAEVQDSDDPLSTLVRDCTGMLEQQPASPFSDGSGFSTATTLQFGSQAEVSGVRTPKEALEARSHVLVVFQ